MNRPSKEHAQFEHYKSRMLEFVEMVRLDLAPFRVSKEVWEVDHRLEFRVYRSYRQTLDVVFEVIDFCGSDIGMEQTEQRLVLDSNVDVMATYNIRGGFRLWGVEIDHAKTEDDKKSFGIEANWLDYDDVDGWEKQFGAIQSSRQMVIRRIKDWYDWTLTEK